MKYFITGGSGFIGTNLIATLMADDQLVRNFSAHPPQDVGQADLFTRGDLLDKPRLREAMKEFQPDIVIHLAARTECIETITVEEGYRANTDGTRHVLEAIAACPTVKRAIITSSQYVCGPERLPDGDEDYFPVTVYGQSKVITEQLTRSAGLRCCWTLIRPTNIWGPWHARYRQEFWRVAASGLYFHPGGAPVVRCYGYVGNIIWQMRRILALPEDVVNGQTFYVSDQEDNIYNWASGFCEGLCGRSAPKVPRTLLASLARIGDLVSTATGRKFPITTSRYQSMTTNYRVPMDKTLGLIGAGPFTLRDGIRATADWLATTGDSAFRKLPRASS